MDKLNDEKFNIEMDIEGFHSFVKYLISRGHDGRWGARQRHWRRYTDVCKGRTLPFHIMTAITHVTTRFKFLTKDLSQKKPFCD